MITGHTGEVSALTIDGLGRIVSGSTDFTIKVWADTGDCIRTMWDHYGIILAMATLKNGKVISSAADRSVKVGFVISVATLVTQLFIKFLHTYTPIHVESMQVWSTNTGECEVSLEAAGSVWCLCPLSDGGFTCGYYSKGAHSSIFFPFPRYVSNAIDWLSDIFPTDL